MTYRHVFGPVLSGRLGRSLGLDLMWGLPGQRLRTFLDSLRQAVSLRPDHLSLYGLSLEPGTPVSFDVLCNEIKGLGLNLKLEKQKEPQAQ